MEISKDYPCRFLVGDVTCRIDASARTRGRNRYMVIGAYCKDPKIACKLCPEYWPICEGVC